jgi:putative nucleotidyltransferase with HDIG domain
MNRQATTYRKRAPRLIVQVLGVSFGVTASVLAAVLLVLSWQTRKQLTRSVVGNLESSQSRFSDLEARRQRERRLQAATLAENPTLKAAVDTYQAESAQGGAAPVQLRNTIQTELAKLQQMMDVPALAVTDARGLILASAGPLASDWIPGQPVPLHDGRSGATVETLLTRRDRVYLTTMVPLQLDGDLIGDICLASPIDDAYARELAGEASADVAVLIGGRVVAGSMAPELRRAIERADLPASGTVVMDGNEFVVRRLLAVDAAQIYAVSNVSAARRAATDEAALVILVIGIAALLLAAAGSWWLAGHLASPIDTLRTTLAQMAEARDFEQPVMPSGASFELDALTETFDVLRQAVSLAEAESEATYLGVIGALAAALDARDPYTAGHSDRVAVLSVAIGRQMQMSEQDLETLRLGAVLHDIGKIGVSDAVLRKPGRLTDDEYEQIKLHPTLGARILKPLHFLAEHLAIVELHHEQPDGRGYPHGLVGDDIPLPARIVHVADAFDAMTTARAYRPGRPATDAMAELWRYAGTGFDLAVVHAMAGMPASVLMKPPDVHPSVETADGTLPGTLVPFRIRSAAALRRMAS